jgi:hypothetical protein
MEWKVRSEQGRKLLNATLFSNSFFLSDVQCGNFGGIGIAHNPEKF